MIYDVCIRGTGVCSGHCLLGDVHTSILGFLRAGACINVRSDVIGRLSVWCGMCYLFWSLLNALSVAPVPQIAARLGERIRGGMGCCEGFQAEDSIDEWWQE